MKKIVALLILLLLLSCFRILFTNVSSDFVLEPLVQSTYIEEDSSTVCIGNDFIEIGFRKDTGALWSILHKSSGVDLRGLKNDTGEGLWDLGFLTDELQHLGPSGIRRSSSYYDGYCVNQSSNEVEIALEWSKIWLEGYGEYPARVVASVKISEACRFANFSLEIDNSGPAAIEEVCYPFIWEVSKLGNESSDDVLVVPDENGRLFRNPSEKLDWWGQTYPSGFCTMQFMAYYDTYGGFYFATYDQDANTKFFCWDGNNSRVGITHYPAIDFGCSFVLSYDVVLGVFDGDWYTAADIYKKWAHKQWWALKDNEVPTWLQEMAVGKDFYCCEKIQNRTFEECIQKIKQHQDYFNLPTLLCLTGWERGGAWAYGDYFPPYEGWDNFDELVHEVHQLNTSLWLLISASQIITDSEPWKNGTARPYAMTYENGSYIVEFRESWQYVFMCPFTNYWRNTLRGYVTTLASHGVDMIQVDGFPWIPQRPCYNSSHGHALGLGGNWYAQTWLDILNDTKQAARNINPSIIFSGEGGAEVFIPFLDVYSSRDSWAEADACIHAPQELFLLFQKGVESIIPLFNYVYNDYMIFIGSHNLALWEPLEGHSYNGLGLSRILTWGEIPCYNLQESLDDINADEVLINYIKKIGYARKTYAHNFLYDSIPIKPMELASPMIQVQDECGSIYNVNSLQYGGWMSNSGSIGYILTNIANITIEVEGTIGIPIQKPYLAYLLRDGKLDWTEISNVTSYNFSFAINPLEIVLLAFTNSTQPWITTCNEMGEKRNIFDKPTSVYVYGGHFIPGINVTFYVIPDNTSASTSNAASFSQVLISPNGELSLSLLWNDSSIEGKYDVWIDVNDNAVFDQTIDIYYDSTLDIYAFEVIPEFSLLATLPLFITATLLASIKYRKKRTVRD